jgi:hypothetical protein
MSQEINMYENQKGMSLVSVLMAIALTGVLAMILMGLMDQQNKQQKKALIDTELTEVYTHFVKIINQSIPCAATFIGLQKGDTFSEFRYSFEANEEPFAEVDKNFRNTKIVLKEMKILTDAELIARNIAKVGKTDDGSTTVVLEVTLEKPTGTLGGNQVKKTFDIRVAMGRGEIIKMPDPNAVLAECTNLTGDGCIASFVTGECNTSKPLEEMIDASTYWFGYCFDPTPPSPADDIIVSCKTV